MVFTSTTFALALTAAVVLSPAGLEAQPTRIPPSGERSSAPASFSFPFEGASKAGKVGVFYLRNTTEGLFASIVGHSGRGTKAIGVLGVSQDGEGVGGLGGRAGVRGITREIAGSGVLGEYKPSAPATGFTEALGASDSGITRGYLGTATAGVMGVADAAGGKGVAGEADGSDNAVGVYGQSVKGLAGFFRGKVTITDHLLVKTIYAQKITAEKGLIGGAGAKLFKIDHPLDPANRFLIHASIESNELKNLYDGIAELDSSGTATVTLPSWFEALNQEYRYQLTCIGGYAPVYVDEEIVNGQFRIAGGRPGLKISWQVTGIRHDAHALANPLEVEQPKTAAERGKYMSPGAHGKPASAGLPNSAAQAIHLDAPSRRR